MALNGLYYADVPLSNYSLTHSLTAFLYCWIFEIQRVQKQEDLLHCSRETRVADNSFALDDNVELIGIVQS